MPVKLNIGLSRKVGEANYGSRGASINLEVELDNGVLGDPGQLRERVRDLYMLARQSVDDELQRPADAGENAHANGNGNENGQGRHSNGNANGHANSKRQRPRKRQRSAATHGSGSCHAESDSSHLCHHETAGTGCQCFGPGTLPDSSHGRSVDPGSQCLD